MNKSSRREFLKASVTTTAAVLAAPTVFAAGSAKLKVGLVGCGGRGTGAALNCCQADPEISIIAMGDLFPDRLASSAQNLEKEAKSQYAVTKDHQYVGWDAYKKVIATDCDIIILATPPAFRAVMLKHAVEAGKHIFMEKPVGVDGSAVKTVFEAYDLAVKKKLCIVAGTQRRHDVAYNAAMKRIHDGALGDIVALYAYWNQGGLWNIPRSEGMTDMEFQLRNWLYYTWLSGDHIVEQHVHNLDVANWAMRSHPVKAVSLGGRQARTDKAYGHIFDHFATEYVYANGVILNSSCRQQENTASRVSEHIVGTKGTSDGNTYIKAAKSWTFAGDRPNPYVEEHRHLIAAIRSGKPINEARQVAESTLTAIMGRMAAYSGQEITWEQALGGVSLMPAKLEFGDLAIPPVAIPGQNNGGTK